MAKKSDKTKDGNKITLTQPRMLEIYHGLSEDTDNLTGVKFTHALLKNERLFKGPAKDLEDTLKPRGEKKKHYEEFVKDLHKLRMSLCKKDKDGEPILIPASKGAVNYNVPFSKTEELKKAEEKLEEKEPWKEVVVELKKAEEEYEAMMEEEKEEEYEFYKIRFDEIDNKITKKQMGIIFDLLEGAPEDQ